MAKVFIISGLSGVGKDSVVDGLKQVGLDYSRVITTTTRSMRSTESEGRPYHFVSEKEFKKMISEDKLFEWARVYNNYYGNTKKAIEQALATNKPVILRIDAQGAKTIKQKIPQAKVIFLIACPKDLKRRLEKRGQDSSKAIQRRLAQVKEEIKTIDQWDYVVDNKEGQLKQTIKKVKNIIKKEFSKI